MLRDNVETASTFLKAIFETKVQNNKNFSLRAFARDIGLSPGGLSQIFSGKKRLSVDRADDISKRLKLNANEAEVFLTLVERGSTSSDSRRADLSEKISILRGDNAALNLTLDQFRLLSSWYGFAILELITVCDPTLSNKAIAKRLNISATEVELTLERLLRLELIEPGKGKQRFVRTRDNFLFSTEVPVEALQRYYKDVNILIEKAVMTQGKKERASGGQVIAFDPKQLEEVRKRINAFLDDLNAFAEKGKNRTEVYQAITHFFKLTEDKGRTP